MIKPVKIIDNVPKPMDLGKRYGKKYRPVKPIVPAGLPVVDTSVSPITLTFNKIVKFMRNVKHSLGTLI